MAETWGFWRSRPRALDDRGLQWHHRRGCRVTRLRESSRREAGAPARRVPCLAARLIRGADLHASVAPSSATITRKGATTVFDHEINVHHRAPSLSSHRLCHATYFGQDLLGGGTQAWPRYSPSLSESLQAYPGATPDVSRTPTCHPELTSTQTVGTTIRERSGRFKTKERDFPLFHTTIGASGDPYCLSPVHPGGGRWTRTDRKDGLELFDTIAGKTPSVWLVVNFLHPVEPGNAWGGSSRTSVAQV